MTVQCFLPRRAYDALDHAFIQATARMAGVERTRWEWSTAKIPDFAPADSGRLTVDAAMAACLVEAFRAQLAKAEAKQDRVLAASTRVAIDRLSAAIVQSTEPFSEKRSPGFGPNS